MGNNHFDSIIIGAGISGISAAHYMQTDCPQKTYIVLEGRKNIGGTWDLFRYPGIRSDSDMYTFGFVFRPWTASKAIAPAKLIMEYLEDTIEEEGIDEHILFEHKVSKAAWSSENALWTIQVDTPSTSKTFTCSFLSLCTGYYDYEKGYTPDFKNQDNFKGNIVHPQKWTDDVQYANQKIVVIGSGATAITLIPALAKQAAHVSMLQRSPTYIVAQPDEDHLGAWLNKLLPIKFAYKINRFRRIMLQRISFYMSQKYPKTMRKLIMKGVKSELGKEYDVETHFNPSYNPWDERLCLDANGEFFKAIKDKKASVITGHIDQFTADGILLKSGELIKADLIVTATGLNATVVSNFDIEVDGQLVDFSSKVSYRGTMLSDIPNFCLAFGYTNASWTLKIDMSNQYFCRIINYMDTHHYKQFCPRQNDPTLELRPLLDFTPGYIQRVIDQLPRLGAKEPWMLKQNYFYDKKILSNNQINDEWMEFK